MTGGEINQVGIDEKRGSALVEDAYLDRIRMEGGESFGDRKHYKK